MVFENYKRKLRILKFRIFSYKQSSNHRFLKYIILPETSAALYSNSTSTTVLFVIRKQLYSYSLKNNPNRTLSRVMHNKTKSRFDYLHMSMVCSIISMYSIYIYVSYSPCLAFDMLLARPIFTFYL